MIPPVATVPPALFAPPVLTPPLLGLPPVCSAPPEPGWPPLAVVPPEPEVPLFWSTTVPAMATPVLCGVMVNVFPEAQYEYFKVSSVVSTLPEVVYAPLVSALKDTNAIPPACWTVAEQLHPPLAASGQLTEE